MFGFGVRGFFFWVGLVSFWRGWELQSPDHSVWPCLLLKYAELVSHMHLTWFRGSVPIYVFICYSQVKPPISGAPIFSSVEGTELVLDLFRCCLPGYLHCAVEHYVLLVESLCASWPWTCWVVAHKSGEVNTSSVYSYESSSPLVQIGFKKKKRY